MACELEEIQHPSTLRQIGKGAFRYCSALKNVQLPEALERVEEEAFYYSNLEEIVIPDHVSYIGSQAFVGNTWDENYNQVPTGPKQVWIGSGLRDLGWNVFRKDAAITTVLNSQRNLCVTFGDLERIPEVLCPRGYGLGYRRGPSGRLRRRHLGSQEPRHPGPDGQVLDHPL